MRKPARCSIITELAARRATFGSDSRRRPSRRPPRPAPAARSRLQRAGVVELGMRQIHRRAKRRIGLQRALEVRQRLFPPPEGERQPSEISRRRPQTDDREPDHDVAFAVRGQQLVEAAARAPVVPSAAAARPAVSPRSASRHPAARVRNLRPRDSNSSRACSRCPSSQCSATAPPAKRAGADWSRAAPGGRLELRPSGPARGGSPAAGSRSTAALSPSRRASRPRTPRPRADRRHRACPRVALASRARPRAFHRYSGWRNRSAPSVNA